MRKLKRRFCPLTLSSIQEEDTLKPFIGVNLAFPNQIKLFTPTAKRQLTIPKICTISNEKPLKHSLSDRLAPLYLPSIESKHKSTKYSTHNNTSFTQSKEEENSSKIKRKPNEQFKNASSPEKKGKVKLKKKLTLPLSYCLNYYANKESIIPGSTCIVRNNSVPLFKNTTPAHNKVKEYLIGKKIWIHNIRTDWNLKRKQFSLKFK